ncbi:EscU/YscU/HrcU family type III secretion system export apparatus switch protein [Pandoraea bronchicola]|uniref:Flagellar biosynthesis protein FlhB n=1 Tax=Pandoraea bronchicola TaxID=2508287 RepID=A0A5E5C295_9BURK|nr:EscU/YscU/HrcU family type III secretion system export apparatus switch protein [Pandoraea bronchicola]VVE90683.1 flagellar biosynthesis protein FlhB [Pandoraea bronchicola]
MADQDLDRNEQATPHKLRKAREKGSVGKSADVPAAVVFTVAVAYAHANAWEVINRFLAIEQRLFAAIRIASEQGSIFSVALWKSVIGELSGLVFPLLFFVCIAGVLANVVQTGPVFAPKALTIDMMRLNPMTGLKKLFSMRSLFDTARALVKFSALAIVTYLALEHVAPSLVSLAALPPQGALRLFLGDLTSIGLATAAALACLAVLDFAYSRREFGKQMRMSKREVKDESKQREGDASIRARLKAMRREMLAKMNSVADTRDADVVITNPTHFAVALRYEHGVMTSPQILSKGTGQMAWMIRTIAMRRAIPIVQNPPLARELYFRAHIGQHVPTHTYAQVARIMVWVLSMRDAQRRAAVGRDMASGGV